MKLNIWLPLLISMAVWGCDSNGGGDDGGETAPAGNEGGVTGAVFVAQGDL